MFGCDGNLAAGAEVSEGLRGEVLDGFGLALEAVTFRVPDKVNLVPGLYRPLIRCIIYRWFGVFILFDILGQRGLLIGVLVLSSGPFDPKNSIEQAHGNHP